MRPVRIANGSGFYGDRLSAPREILEGPDPVDVLTGDYLAELTMLLLWKARRRDPDAGYASTFVRQMEEVLGTCLDRGVRVVTNAGGLNPQGLADRLGKVAAGLGLDPAIAVVEGDDLIDRLDDLQAQGHSLANLDTGQPLAAEPRRPLTANAYLGCWGIVEALRAGADVVVCPRVTDASLVVGPAAWWHGWDRRDWDALAGAVVAGHIVECGPQTTGGNYPFLDELPDRRKPGFPIAEVAADGSSVITKQPGTGGVVNVGTVTAQLLYEIAEPAYANPDVVARFDTIEVSEDGPDRVAVRGVRGEPAPASTKVALNFDGGFRNTMTMVLTGLDIEGKAALAEHMLFDALGGKDQFALAHVDLVRTDHPDAPTNEQATALLRVTVQDPDPAKVGRRFSSAVVELGLASYAGFHTTTPPTSETAFGVYWPALVPASLVEHRVRLADGRVVPIAPTEPGGDGAAAPVVAPRNPNPATTGWGPTRRAPLGLVCGARSGDKGGNANVGLWTADDRTYEWLASFLTVDRLRQLVPEAGPLEVRRYELPNLRALNFVIVGILGEGVAASVRADAQAKGLGEYVRSRLVDLPTELPHMVAGWAGEHGSAEHGSAEPGSAEPGSAEEIRGIVGPHQPADDREAASKGQMLAELDRLPNPCDESGGPVHVTASAIVAGPRGTVLHRHRRLGRWMQPGGHIDPGEHPWDAALRETREETGLAVEHPAGGPLLLQLDVHEGPRGHTHLDLRYLLVAPDRDPTPPPGESPDVAWFTWEEAASVADPALTAALQAARGAWGGMAA